MKMITNDEDYISITVTDRAYEISHKLVLLFRDMNFIDDRVNYLHLISIYYNNKMMEVYHYLKNHGISYRSSNIVNGVSFYLFDLVLKAVDCLKDYAKFIVQEMSEHKLLINADYIREKGSNYIKRYEELCEELYNFSIEKDVVDAINYQYDTMMQENEELFNVIYSGNNGLNAEIDEINRELQTLGISGTVEHRPEPSKVSFGEITSEQIEEMQKRFGRK